MKVQSVTKPYEGAEQVKMSAVCGNPKEGGGYEDNEYATATPCASLDITIQNPALLGTIKEGMTFYVDFTEHVA